jgi:hypothetical protein
VRQQRSSQQRSGDDERSSSRSEQAGSPARVADAGKRHIASLTAKSVEGVTSVDRGDDGVWLVGVEVVEDRRIPPAADVLALYESEIDDEGSLLGYHRVGRYTRGRTSPLGSATGGDDETGPSGGG